MRKHSGSGVGKAVIIERFVVDTFHTLSQCEEHGMMEIMVAHSGITNGNNCLARQALPAPCRRLVVDCCFWCIIAPTNISRDISRIQTPIIKHLVFAAAAVTAQGKTDTMSVYNGMILQGNITHEA